MCLCLFSVHKTFFITYLCTVRTYILGGAAGSFQTSNEPQGVAIMKSHIKDLIAQLSKAEDDKEKIAKEAYCKAMEIKREADKRLEDAHACQIKQASLIERLKVRSHHILG